MELNRKKKRQKHNVVNKSVDSMDRISQLPRDIKHQILFFLPTKDAAKTSILSKTWLHSWSLFPNFDFDKEYFCLKHNTDGRHSGGSRVRRFKKEEFMNFINDTLQRRLEQNITINKFRLCLPKKTSRDLEMNSHIDRWVSIAMERNAKELEVELELEFYLAFKVKDNAYYNLPQTVFDSTTITVLKLNGCSLKPYGEIKLSHLQKLCLESVYIDQKVLDNLTSSCPSLEDLRLKYCHTLTYLKVPSLLLLNRIEVYGCRYLEQIKIGTPSLQTFQYERGSLDHECEVDLKACEILKELKFGRKVNVEDQLLQDFSSKFPNLEVLILNGCFGLKNIDISSQKLKRLVLRHIYLAVAKIDTPNLISLECVHNSIDSYSMHTPKLREVKLEFKNGTRLADPEDLHRLRWHEYPDWYDELKETVGKFANFNGFKLVIEFEKFAFIHEDLKGITIPSHENFKNLELSIKITSMNLSDLMKKLSSGSALHTISVVSLSDSKLSKILHEEPRYSFASLEEINSFDEVEDDDWDNWKLYEKLQYKATVTLVKLNENMQYKTTTFRVMQYELITYRGKVGDDSEEDELDGYNSEADEDDDYDSEDDDDEQYDGN